MGNGTFHPVQNLSLREASSMYFQVFDSRSQLLKLGLYPFLKYPLLEISSLDLPSFIHLQKYVFVISAFGIISSINLLLTIEVFMSFLSSSFLWGFVTLKWSYTWWAILKLVSSNVIKFPLTLFNILVSFSGSCTVLAYLAMMWPA